MKVFRVGKGFIKSPADAEYFIALSAKTKSSGKTDTGGCAGKQYGFHRIILLRSIQIFFLPANSAIAVLSDIVPFLRIKFHSGILRFR